MRESAGLAQTRTSSRQSNPRGVQRYTYDPRRGRGRKDRLFAARAIEPKGAPGEDRRQGSRLSTSDGTEGRDTLTGGVVHELDCQNAELAAEEARSTF